MQRAKGRQDHAAMWDVRCIIKVMEKCLCTDYDCYSICSFCEQQVCMHTKKGKETLTQSDEDGDKLFFILFWFFLFFWEGGLKVSDREIRDSSSSEFTLLVLFRIPLGEACC